MSKKPEYQSLTRTTLIAATSRCAIKVDDTFYTMEYHEERQVPDLPDVDLVKERELLWDTCNSEVDKQVEDVMKLYKK